MKVIVMKYYKLYEKKISWLVLGIFGITGSLLLVSIMLLALGGNFNYSSFGFQITSYAPPSHGYLLDDEALLPAASNRANLNHNHSPWAGSLHERQKHAWPMVRRLSEREDLDPALVMALVHVESRFNPSVVSNRGAVGLMQINPPTARHLGLTNPTDPEANLKAGIKYLSTLRRMFDNDIRLMLAAYNAGPSRVLASRQVPEIKETLEFVEKVLAQREHFRSRFQ